VTQRSVLVVSHHPPDFHEGGASRRLAQHMCWLQLDGWAVSLFATEGIPDPRLATRLRRMGIAVFAPGSAGLEMVLETRRPALVLFECWQSVERHLAAVRELLPAARSLIDTVDLQLLRDGGSARMQSNAFPEPRSFQDELGSEVARELNVYASCDGVLAVSSREAELLRDLLGGTIAAIPVHDAAAELKPAPLAKRRGVVFVGSFGHASDAGAVEYLCREIVPLVDRRLLDDHPVLIVGPGIDQRVLASGRGLEGRVRMVGEVPSVVPYLAQARFALAPVLFGGARCEVVQSFMTGTPVVSTTVGVERLDVADSEHLLLADSPDEFAASMTQLLEDDALCRALGRSGRREVERTHSEGAARSALLAAVAVTVDSAPAGRSPPPPPSTRRSPERIRRLRNEKTMGGVRLALDRVAPRGASIAVASEGSSELLQLGHHVARHFPCDADGYFRGNPSSPAEAIALVEGARDAGTTFFFLPATSTWWLDHYDGLRAHLEGSCRSLLEDEQLGAIYVLNENRVADRRDVERIAASGLFDESFYRDAYGHELSPDASPLEDFCATGWMNGRQPNAYFHTSWYLQTYADATSFGCNPLVEYLSTPSRRPNPLFDPDFYRVTYMDDASATDPLLDYLSHVGRGEWRNTVDLFDVDFYLAANPDIAQAKIDPVLHFMHTGHREGRDPSRLFCTSYYRARYLNGKLDVNPLAHHYDTPSAYRRPTAPGRHDLEEEVTEQIRSHVNPSPSFEDFKPEIATGAARHAKVVAFYLPQFHTIPENDEWWGTGFTEWRNVMRGVPRFAGHFQPRIPRDLGFYDLTDGVTLGKQIELARAAGIYGFSFYYYWFNGRRLLDRPVEQFLADRALDFPFCLTWANENWTKRWDGQDDEVLMAQEYDESLDGQFVDDLQRHFDDERYIRLGGRPLLIVYRLDVIPDVGATIERWRTLWRNRHSEEPVIFHAQAFGKEDLRETGVDGAVEFPPHRLVQGMTPTTTSLRILDPGFSGHVFDYKAAVRSALARKDPGYPLIRTAVPSWDNDARRQGQGLVLRGSTPELYERWLRGLVRWSADHPVLGERMVFVNAWNEWAEAAYLEPDVHYGSAYLNATARAVCELPRSAKRKVLLVGHDAHQHGAQHILWHIGDCLRNRFGCEVASLLLDGGPMQAKFERLGRTQVVSGAGAIRAYVAELAQEGHRLAITNTAVAGPVVPLLKDEGFRVVSLIHELSGIVASYKLEHALEQIVDRSDAIVVPSKVVASALGLTGRPSLAVRPQGLYHGFHPRPEARSEVRETLGVPASSSVVLNVGFADHRKGVDVFLAVAEQSARERDDLRFIWVGNVHDDFSSASKQHAPANVRFLPYTDDIGDYFAAADAFFLSSREDPFPSVVLEALQAGLPVVAFRDSGGAEELAAAYGAVAERDDVIGALAALRATLAEDTPTAQKTRRRFISSRFRYDDYCSDLLRLLEPETKKISVIVPNYNYRQYLRSRLLSVFEQSYPVFEVIVLDDASTDGSVEELEAIQAETGRRIRIVRRTRNSGSVFRQWVAGCREARGDYIWIAEADDLAKPEFLERLAPLLDDRTAFAFSNSTPIDADGHLLGASYDFYYRAAGASRMEGDFLVPGEQFVRECLAERNLVLNVSSVLWNRTRLHRTLRSSLNDLREYKLTGDWHLYVTAALDDCRVGYVAEPLNVHRRHDGSVTGALAKGRHVDEVRKVHDHVLQSLGDDKDVEARMAEYVRELEHQFGLESSNGEGTRARASANQTSIAAGKGRG
jgi:glycosyltransferase involved in cell wall biosynthesis